MLLTALTFGQRRFPLSLTHSSPLKNLLSTVLLQIDQYIGKRGQDRSNFEVRQMRANQEMKLTTPHPRFVF